MQRQASRFVGRRAQELPASPTIAVMNQAAALRKQGVDVVDFGPGEPDLDTPPHVRAAAAQALEDGHTHYAPSRGVPELREAIAEKLERENNLRYAPDTEIVVTPGAKQALVEALLTAVGEGDEVLVLEPCWGSYAAIAQLAGARPVHVPLCPDFTIDPDALRGALTERTRAIVVGTPGNPTGHVLRREELEVLTAVCRERDVLLISDEIYERITYSGVQMVSPATLPDMWERTVTINGFSKAYAMTGWRLGYAAAPEPFMRHMVKIHEQTVTTAATFSQMGAVAALRGPQEPLARMVEEFARRREIVVDGLNAVSGVRCVPPDGAFYAFPDVSGTGMTGTELAEMLLEHGVAVTPGAGFGDGWDTHVRLSFATSEERILTGLERMAEALG